MKQPTPKEPVFFDVPFDGLVTLDFDKSIQISIKRLKGGKYFQKSNTCVFHVTDDHINLSLTNKPKKKTKRKTRLHPTT